MQTAWRLLGLIAQRERQIDREERGREGRRKRGVDGGESDGGRDGEGGERGDGGGEGRTCSSASPSGPICCPSRPRFSESDPAPVAAGPAGPFSQAGDGGEHRPPPPQCLSLESRSESGRSASYALCPYPPAVQLPGPCPSNEKARVDSLALSLSFSLSLSLSLSLSHSLWGNSLHLSPTLSHSLFVLFSLSLSLSLCVSLSLSLSLPFSSSVLLTLCLSLSLSRFREGARERPPSNTNTHILTQAVLVGVEGGGRGGGHRE